MWLSARCRSPGQCRRGPLAAPRCLRMLRRYSFLPIEEPDRYPYRGPCHQFLATLSGSATVFRLFARGPPGAATKIRLVEHVVMYDSNGLSKLLWRSRLLCFFCLPLALHHPSHEHPAAYHMPMGLALRLRSCSGRVLGWGIAGLPDGKPGPFQAEGNLSRARCGRCLQGRAFER